jgi:hypothetical protein
MTETFWVLPGSIQVAGFSSDADSQIRVLPEKLFPFPLWQPLNI